MINLNPSNVLLATQLLTQLGYAPRIPLNPSDFANEQIREQWVKEKGLVVFSFFKTVAPLTSVVLFAKYPIAFEPLLKRSVTRSVQGVDVRVCSLDDLIAAKASAGRPRDLEDVRQLKMGHGRE